MTIPSYGARPGWLEAKDECPGGCQSWVANATKLRASSRLTAATTASPSATGRLPPGMKVGCTSTTPSAPDARSSRPLMSAGVALGRAPGTHALEPPVVLRDRSAHQKRTNDGHH